MIDPDHLYPTSVADALARWDRGDSVFTIEMGGLGPGYEQVIHLLVFEALRPFANDTGDLTTEDYKKSFFEGAESAIAPAVAALQPSGGQAAVALSVAYQYLTRGWIDVINEVKATEPDRIIQVTRNFPRFPA